MTQRLFSLIATLTIFFSSNSQTFTIDDITYTLTTSSTVAVFECTDSKTEVVVPEMVQYNNITYSVTSIGRSAFYNRASLQFVTLPNSVASIGIDAFYGCSSLQSFNIPSSVSIIKNSTFYGCVSLQSIDIPNSVTQIEEWAFCYCSSLTSLHIPNSVTVIDNFAFWGCSALTTIDIPSSISSIGKSTFYNCTSLQSVILPNSITSIGESAFYGCSSLTQLYSCASIPPVCSPFALTDIDKSKCELWVPIGCSDAYKAADQWKDFYMIKEELPTNVEPIPMRDTHDMTEVFNLNGVKIADTIENLAPGVYIVRKNGKTSKIAIQ